MGNISNYRGLHFCDVHEFGTSSDNINFLHMNDWTTPQNILSIVLIIVTLAYTVTSVLSWLETRAARLQKNAPNMIAYLKSNVSHEMLYVCIKNIGEGCATNVRIIPSTDYHLLDGCLQLKDFPLFSEGVNIFPPQYEMIFPLNSWVAMRNENPIREFNAFYSDLEGKERSRHFTLPFKQIATLSQHLQRLLKRVFHTISMRSRKKLNI